MDQQCKPVMASVHNQRTSSLEKSGGTYCQSLHHLLHMNYLFLSNKQKNYLVLLNALDKLTFETNKLPIGKGECTRNTSQDERRDQHHNITRVEPTRVAINYFNSIRSRLSLARY